MTALKGGREGGVTYQKKSHSERLLIAEGVLLVSPDAFLIPFLPSIYMIFELSPIGGEGCLSKKGFSHT